MRPVMSPEKILGKTSPSGAGRGSENSGEPGRVSSGIAFLRGNQRQRAAAECSAAALRGRVTAGLLAVNVERGGAPDGDVLELGVGARDVDHGAGRQRELVRVDLDVAGDADGQTFVDVFLRDSCDSFDLSPICNTFLS
jgi:hypothetical protein